MWQNQVVLLANGALHLIHESVRSPVRMARASDVVGRLTTMFNVRMSLLRYEMIWYVSTNYGRYSFFHDLVNSSCVPIKLRLKPIRLYSVFIGFMRCVSQTSISYNHMEITRSTKCSGLWRFSSVKCPLCIKILPLSAIISREESLEINQEAFESFMMCFLNLYEYIDGVIVLLVSSH